MTKEKIKILINNAHAEVIGVHSDLEFWTNFSKELRDEKPAYTRDTLLKVNKRVVKSLERLKEIFHEIDENNC